MAAGDILYPIIVMAAHFGLRRSEIAGLRWRDINLKEQYFWIEHTISKVNYAVAKDKAKNRSSHRRMPFGDDTLEMLIALKDTEDENRKLYDNTYSENDYVFKWPDGRPISVDYISQHFSKILRDNNLRHIRFHDLRHSCATLLHASGHSIKAISSWLGHSNIGITADIYTHFSDNDKTQMSDDLDSLLKKPYRSELEPMAKEVEVPYQKNSNIIPFPLHKVNEKTM